MQLPGARPPKGVRTAGRGLGRTLSARAPHAGCLRAAARCPGNRRAASSGGISCQPADPTTRSTAWTRGFRESSETEGQQKWRSGTRRRLRQVCGGGRVGEV